MASAEVATLPMSRLEWFACVGPAEGLGKDCIEVLDEVEETLTEFLLRLKRGTLECPSSKDAEPDFDLVQPGGMARSIHEADAVLRVFEELFACCHILQDPALILEAEIADNLAALCNEPYKRLRFVRVELIDHECPGGVGIGVDGLLNVGGEVLLCSSRSDARTDDFTRDHVEVREQAQGAVTLVFKLDTLGHAGPCRLRWVDAFERLDACLLVGADDVTPLLGQLRRICICLAHLTDVCLVQLRVLQLILRGQPVS